MNSNNIKLEFENRELKKAVKLLSSKNTKLKLENKNYADNFESKVSNTIKNNEKFYENQIITLKKIIAIKEDREEKLKTKLEKEKQLHNKDNEEKDAKIEALEEKIIKLQKENDILNSKLNLDSKTAGIPTSMTPINKKKIIPNTREKTEKSIGGQKGHSKHKLEKFTEEEINENVDETLDICPNCGSNELKELNNETTKDELDYEIKIIKRRHHFKEYECNNCHKIVKKDIPNNLKEDNQYGNKVKAHALALTNIGNVPINKTRRIISGLTNNEINLSEGFISKLQVIVSKKLEEFITDLENYVIGLNTLYWDDTVIFINTKRACLRYYGDSTVALYKAHNTKGKPGIDEDNILARISSKQRVVHDHNKVNYNDEYIYINVECCQHLERDLEKVKLNIPESEWAIQLKKHFSSWEHKRVENIEHDIKSFTSDETNDFMIEFDNLILKGIEENKKHSKSHYYGDEKALLNRLIEYRDNYTYWLYDYSIPYTNNESERSLRGVKTKLKVSGQFQNIEHAKYYANIKSYIETCKRNGINEYSALEKLLDNIPYTIDEIFNSKKSEEI